MARAVGQPVLSIPDVAVRVNEPVTVTVELKFVFPLGRRSEVPLRPYLWCGDGSWAPLEPVFTDTHGRARLSFPPGKFRLPGKYFVGWKRAEENGHDLPYIIGTITVKQYNVPRVWISPAQSRGIHQVITSKNQ